MLFLKSLGWRSWLAIACALIIFVLYMQNNRMKAAVTKANGTIATQAVEVKTQAAVIKIDKVIKKIDEETQLKVDKAVKAAVKKHEAVAVKVADRERDIHIKFIERPVSVETVGAEQLELAEVRIDSLWEAYCLTQPDNPDCTLPPTIHGATDA
jgi:hypothetical protein